MNNIIAIITARGGSKRIPKKNIKFFFGKPMISYAINACKESGVFDEIMVSTDSEEIATIAEKYGAKIPFFRSIQTANDFATTSDALCEVIANYKIQGIEFEYLCCIYPCVPFLTGKTLKDAYIQFITSKVNGLQPVCKYPVPVEWAMQIQNGLLFPINPQALNTRSQDLVPLYFDAGMFYFLKTGALLEQKTLVPDKTLGYIVDEKEIQDIDTPEDWESAELKYRILKGNNNG
jgi:N-acylneuraminate cytidylyltransferase